MSGGIDRLIAVFLFDPKAIAQYRGEARNTLPCKSRPGSQNRIANFVGNIRIGQRRAQAAAEREGEVARQGKVIERIGEERRDAEIAAGHVRRVDSRKLEALGVEV